MRDGLTLPFEHVVLGEMAGLLAEAERLGYVEAWSYERNVFDAFTPLAAAATTVAGMRLGTSIVPAFTRPAGLIAMSAAALAEMVPGRFVLGLGASTKAIVTGWMGLPFARPLARERDALQTVRALLAGERVGGLRLDRPPRVPVPIYLAALGERALRLAGDVADGLLLFMAGPRVVPHLLAGSGGKLDSVARVPVVCGADHERNMTFARRFVTGYATVPFYARFLAMQGFDAEIAELTRRWSAGDRRGAAAAVSDAMVHELAIVVTEPAWPRRLAAYEAAGLGAIDLWFLSPAEAGERARDTERALRLLAPAGRSGARSAGE